MGWRPSLVCWRPLLLGWRRLLVGWGPSLVGWRPLLAAARLEAIAIGVCFSKCDVEDLNKVSHLIKKRRRRSKEEMKGHAKNGHVMR